jgi:hypothetical protein
MTVNRISGIAAVTLLLTVIAPHEAQAYIGPGAGLSAIGALLAIFAAILLAIVGFVWYPIKRLLRRKQKDEIEESPDKLAESNDEDQSDDSTEQL